MCGVAETAASMSAPAGPAATARVRPILELGQRLLLTRDLLRKRGNDDDAVLLPL